MKTWTTDNPKKYLSARRKSRPGYEPVKIDLRIGYVDVSHKSRAGVEYTKYKKVLIQRPKVQTL